MPITKIHNCIKCNREVELAHSAIEEDENDEWYGFSEDGNFGHVDIFEVLCDDCAIEEYAELF